MPAAPREAADVPARPGRDDARPRPSDRREPAPSRREDNRGDDGLGRSRVDSASQDARRSDRAEGKSGSDKSEADKSEAARSEAASSDAARLEKGKSNAKTSEAIKADEGHCDAGRCETDVAARLQAGTSDAAKAEQGPSGVFQSQASDDSIKPGLEAPSALVTGQQDTGALVTIAAAQQLAVLAEAGMGDGEAHAGEDGTAATTGPDEPADTLDPAGAGPAPTPADAAAAATVAGPEATGQMASPAGTAQPGVAPVDAAILLAAAAPAPTGTAPGEDQTDAATASAAATRPAKDAAKGLERAAQVSVAHAARQQLAEEGEGAAETPFGAVVSALAKSRETADGAPAAVPGAAARPEAKPGEPVQAPLQPIDLGFLSQMRQPRADGPALAPPAADGASAPAPGASQAATGGPATPLHVVPIEIGLRALAGGRKFDIRLDPAELGRVDVNLEISDAGEVTAKLVVDRVETLQLLQRDARTLERAFEQAGLKPSDSGVDITLRDPSDQSGFRQNRNQDEPPRRGRSRADTIEDITAPAEAASARRLVRLGGVDLSI